MDILNSIMNIRIFLIMESVIEFIVDYWYKITDIHNWIMDIHNSIMGYL